MGIVPVPKNGLSDPTAVLQEIPVVNDADLAGNGSLGFTIDRPRNRVVVAIGDAIGNKYSAVAAYDLNTWNRLFLTQLSGSGTYVGLLTFHAFSEVFVVVSLKQNNISATLS